MILVVCDELPGPGEGATRHGLRISVSGNRYLTPIFDPDFPVESHDQYDQYGHKNLEVPPMITQTSALSFRQNLGEMLNQVQYRRDSILINKDGKPVAALIDARLFERIRRMQGRFDTLCQRIEEGYAGVPETEGIAEIDAAIAAERQAAQRRPD
jgi:prevent-host-death family protein